MTINHKTLSAFEVATAEEAQTYFMDQVVVKVTNSSELSSLPTTVKTAYVTSTGILMARNVANTWVSIGGVASVGETAPSNPQTGQLWVKPSEVLPLPVRTMMITTNQVISATTWTALAGTVNFVTTKPVMCIINGTGLINSAASSAARARLVWSGATANNSYTMMNGYAGALYSGIPERTHGSMTFGIVLNTGTTTFQWEVIREGVSNGAFVDAGINITPVSWADAYADGVS